MVITYVVCLIAALSFFESRADEQALVRPASIDRFANFIAEASTRFAIPERWIRAVIQIESAGDEHAISPRGALGLMQLMPTTWVELSVRYKLGLDPFDPRDDIMAGTAYVRELRDRFGWLNITARSVASIGDDNAHHALPPSSNGMEQRHD